MTGRALPRSCVTLDLHDLDLPEDIEVASGWLAEARIRATFLVPGALLTEPRYERVLRALPALGHEVGSHSHRHDWEEIEALSKGGRLGFLARSKALHEAFFGSPPVSFRSPRWCSLAPATRAELARLGYRADSSATPQRPALLTSMPLGPGWFGAPRAPRLLAPGLVELPTSTLLFPAASATFRVLRRASGPWLGLLEAEARVLRNRVLVVQLHVEDLNPATKRSSVAGRLTWVDFLPRPRGGWGFKWFLQDCDPVRTAKRQRSLVRRIARAGCATLGETAGEWLKTHG